jgi:propanol-preferring alcohol dehydrogenase
MAPGYPSTQKAQIFADNNTPILYKDVPVREPGPDEVLVHIKYTGVCHTDLQ